VELNAAINQKDLTTINETTVETIAPDYKKTPVMLKSHKNIISKRHTDKMSKIFKISTLLDGTEITFS